MVLNIKNSFDIPLARYIDINDSEQVLRAIRRAEKDVPIDIILHTLGGLALAATLIAIALKAHPAKKTVTGPHYAMSGETLIDFASVPLVRRKMHPFLFSNRSQAAIAAHATLQSYCDYRAHKIRLNCAFGQKSLHCLYRPDL